MFDEKNVLTSNDSMSECSTFTGMHERHLRRKDSNPLFGVPAPQFPMDAYAEARRLDSEEMGRFQADMRQVIQQAIDLDANVESEVVLELRAKLDQLYARCSGLGGNCGEHKRSIRKLIDVVMNAVWQAAADDPMARMELEQEEVARQQHFCLMEYPLISDLMRPDTPISQDELLPTLLQADEDELEAVMWMFEPEQLQDIREQAHTLLVERREQGYALPEAWASLQLISEHLESEC